MNETRTLATWAATLELDEVPGDVREFARSFILDNLGCQIAGARLPWSQAYYKVLSGTRSGTHSTVAYFGNKLAPDDAAFINSAFNHSNETDGSHLRSSTHPGSVAVPAALALGEYAQADGRKFLTAVIAACEVQIRIGWACAPHLAERGHHPPVGVGPFGAAAAGAVLMGFDPSTALNALAIAGSHSAGVFEYVKTGGSVKRMHSAIPTAAGVRAALFAQAGITGPYSILEGEKGFCKVFAGKYDLQRITDGLGTQYHMLDTAFKPHSCVHFIQAAFDALDLARDREPVSAEQIKQLTVYTNNERVIVHTGSITEPEDILGAQFSLPFSMAMRLYHGGRGVHGGNGFWDYPNVNLKDPKLLATARKVKCALSKEGDGWSLVDRGMGIEIETTDGRRIRETVSCSKGFPEHPMSKSEVQEKFCSLVEPVLSPARALQIMEAVDGLEKIGNIGELARLLVMTPGN